MADEATKAATAPPGAVPEAPPPAYQPMHPQQQQQAMYPPAHHHVGGTTAVIVAAPVATVYRSHHLGPHPMQVTCPNCRSAVTTRTTDSPGATAWILGLIICMLGGYCCACIPCCMDQFKETKHYCPNCNAFIGRHHGG